MEIKMTLHAMREALADRIISADIRSVLENGEILESYPDDKPLPSRLLLGWIEFRPLHIVAAYRARTDEEIIITVYEPDTDKWTDDFRRRS